MCPRSHSWQVAKPFFEPNSSRPSSMLTTSCEFIWRAEGMLPRKIWAHPAAWWEGQLEPWEFCSSEEMPCEMEMPNGDELLPCSSAEDGVNRATAKYWIQYWMLDPYIAHILEKSLQIDIMPTLQINSESGKVLATCPKVQSQSVKVTLFASQCYLAVQTVPLTDRP